MDGELLNRDQLRAFLRQHPKATWTRRGDLFEVFTTPAPKLVFVGGPMTYRRPKPLDAEQIDKIVRRALRSEAPSQKYGSQLQDAPGLMSIEVVARRLGVHPDTVKRLARRGGFQHYKVTKKLIKFDEQQYQHFLEKVRSGAVRLPSVHRFPLLTNKRSSS
jgi:excisionase family DNA binding protein